LYALRSGVRKPNEEERDLYSGKEKFINETGDMDIPENYDAETEIYKNMKEAMDNEILDKSGNLYGGKWFKKFKLGIKQDEPELPLQ
jgi:hypothetical protein